MNAMINFVRELHRRSAILFYLGMVLLTTFVIYLVVLPTCPYAFAEICHWLKPGKFALSFALYVMTLGWFIEYLRGELGERKVGMLIWAIALSVIAEMGLIFTQSWLGSGQFSRLGFSANINATLSSGLFHVTNALIVFNMLIVFYLMLQFFRPIALKPTSYLWGVRGGFVIFILSCFLGLFMLVGYGQVPPDAKHYGIPFTLYSSKFEILTSIHFLGIHYLQLLPLASFYLPRFINKTFVLSNIGLYILVSLFLILEPTQPEAHLVAMEESMNSESPSYLYKIVSLENWDKSQFQNFVVLPKEDREFIHLSTEQQLERIVQKYWSNGSPYVILKVDSHQLPGQLIYEANPGGANKYYHLYQGAIPLKAVLEVVNKP